MCLLPFFSDAEMRLVKKHALYKVTAEWNWRDPSTSDPSFKNEETEAQKGEVSGSRSHSHSAPQSPGLLGPGSRFFCNMLRREAKELTETFLSCTCYLTPHQGGKAASSGHLSPPSPMGLTRLSSNSKWQARLLRVHSGDMILCRKLSREYF